LSFVCFYTCFFLYDHFIINIFILRDSALFYVNLKQQVFGGQTKKSLKMADRKTVIWCLVFKKWVKKNTKPKPTRHLWWGVGRGRGRQFVSSGDCGWVTQFERSAAVSKVFVSELSGRTQ